MLGVWFVSDIQCNRETGPLIVAPNEHDELVNKACGLPSVRLLDES